MTFEKTYTVQEDNQLIIRLPARFKTGKLVRVIIEDVKEKRQEKIKKMKKASTDPLFLEDIKEVDIDFQNSDNELK